MKFHGRPSVLETSEVHIRAELNDVRRHAAGTVLPAHFPAVPLESINVPYTLRVAGTISADEDQITCDQWVTVEAYLLAVVADIIAPLHLTTSLVDGVESARTGTEE